MAELSPRQPPLMILPETFKDPRSGAKMRVRKTLVFGGPTTEALARSIAEAVLRGEIRILPMTKWEPDSYGYGRHPVETIIDNDPQIVAVSEVAGDG